VQVFFLSLALDATLSREALLLHMWTLHYRGTVGLIVGQTDLGLCLDSGSCRRRDEGVVDLHTVLGRLAKVLRTPQSTTLEVTTRSTGGVAG
jgi:hypothetical protein